MLRLLRTSQFKKDFKKLRSAGRDLGKLAETIRRLQNKEPLPEAMRDHLLTGNYKDHRESGARQPSHRSLGGEPGPEEATIRMRERLGGLLKYYHREAA